MSESFVNIRGSITGDDNVKKMLFSAPEEYEKTIEKQLFKERRSFVGDSSKDGIFRKKLLKKTNSKGGTWSKGIVKLFKGYVTKGKNINMTLEMGLISTREHKIHKILESLQDTHYIQSNKFMPIPVYKNIGYVNSPYKLFKRKIYSKELTLIFKRNKILYFDKTGSKDLLFVGKKRIKVKKQFNFINDWNKRLPKVIDRYKKAIDKTTLKLEKKYG